MQTQKTPSLENLSIEASFKDLSLSLEKDSTHNNMLSPSNSSTCFLGDHIGMESCVDLMNNNNEEIVHTSNIDVFSQIRVKRDQQYCAMKKKEFPPPIPLLARTENLHSHMPWVLKRHYTSDGRLILIEERVKHHEYFRAHRSNGRLTLKLVPLDDDGLVPPSGIDEEDINDNENENDNENYCNVNEEGYMETEDGGGNDNDNDINVEEEINVYTNEEGLDQESSVMKYESLIPESLSMENGKSGPAKCLNYNTVRTSSSCFLGMAVPAMRPVHT